MPMTLYESIQKETKKYSIEDLDYYSYIEWLKENNYPIETELDKLCLKVHDLADTYTKYNTIAMNIYPGFDNSPEEHVSPEEAEKYHQYKDKYEELREEAADILFNQIYTLPDSAMDDKVIEFLKGGN